MNFEVRFQMGGRLEFVESVVEMRAMGAGVIVRFRAVGSEIWFQITPASVRFGTDNDDMEREDIEMMDAE
jgi:hypothetical protein